MSPPKAVLGSRGEMGAVCIPAPFQIHHQGKPRTAISGVLIGKRGKMQLKCQELHGKTDPGRRAALSLQQSGLHPSRLLCVQLAPSPR